MHINDEDLMCCSTNQAMRRVCLPLVVTPGLTWLVLTPFPPLGAASSPLGPAQGHYSARQGPILLTLAFGLELRRRMVGAFRSAGVSGPRGLWTAPSLPAKEMPCGNRWGQP